MGGAFGSKESRSIFVSCAAAVAASIMKKPIHVILTRKQDMSEVGGRHPYLIRYKVGVKLIDGIIKINAVHNLLYSNGGNSLDLSNSILNRAVTHSLNAYYCPNVRAEGRSCKTHTPSSTAFRGFGAP